MSEKRGELDRRDFLKSGVRVAAGAALIGSGVAGGAAPGTKQIPLTGKMPARKLGATGHVVPVLGCGGSAMVRKWSEGYNVELGSEEERAAMVRRAYDLGVRYFDTARVYDESERIMGRGLAGVRENVYLASKVADARPQGVRASVETSLEQLQTTYVDCMQIHSPAIEAVGFEGAMKLYEELRKLRDEGMIRFIGLTTHVAFQTVYRLVDTGGFDQVLLARGYMRKGMDQMLSNQNVEWSEKCVARAHSLGMGIIVMKVMGARILGRGGAIVVADYDPEKRRKLPAAALRWALQDERTSVIIVGMSVLEDVVENVETMTGDPTLTDEDRALLADYASRAYESDYLKALPVV